MVHYRQHAPATLVVRYRLLRPCDQVSHIGRGDLPSAGLFVGATRVEAGRVPDPCRYPVTGDGNVGLDMDEKGVRKPGSEKERRPRVERQCSQGGKLNRPKPLDQPVICDHDAIVGDAPFRHQRNDAPEVQRHDGKVQCRSLAAMRDEPERPTIEAAAVAGIADDQLDPLLLAANEWVVIREHDGSGAGRHARRAKDGFKATRDRRFPCPGKADELDDPDGRRCVCGLRCHEPYHRWPAA